MNVLLRFIYILIISAPAWSALAVENAPMALIKQRNERITEILESSGEKVDDATREELKDVINGLMDFKELSRLSLGKYWDERSPQEKEDFARVFQQLIRNSSVKKLEIYKADRMVYEPAEIDNGKATVNTIAYKGRKQIEILYKMHKVGPEWRVYDIEIDGVSTARNYRESFYKQIRKNGYEATYQKLENRLEETSE